MEPLLIRARARPAKPSSTARWSPPAQVQDSLRLYWLAGRRRPNRVAEYSHQGIEIAHLQLAAGTGLGRWYERPPVR